MTYNLISKPKTTILPKYGKNFIKLQENDKNIIFLYFPQKTWQKNPQKTKFKAKKYPNKILPFPNLEKAKNFQTNMEEPSFHKKSNTQNILY